MQDLAFKNTKVRLPQTSTYPMFAQNYVSKLRSLSSVNKEEQQKGPDFKFNKTRLKSNECHHL